MRIALLSDIHANLYALTAVLAHCERQQVDTYWFLGDLVGRGYQPVEVVKRVRSIFESLSPLDQSAWLLGNHDLNVLGLLDTDSALDKGDSPKRTQEIVLMDFDAHQVDMENCSMLMQAVNQMNWVRHAFRRTHAQPYPDKGIYLAHGSYRLMDSGKVDPIAAHSGVLKEPSTIKWYLRDLATLPGDPPRLFIGGHTHISMVWRYDRVTGEAEPLPHKGAPLTLNLNEHLYYVNAGSLGFPRETDRYPTYAVLEVDSSWQRAVIEFHEVPYEIDPFRINMPGWYPPKFWEDIRRRNE